MSAKTAINWTDSTDAAKTAARTAYLTWMRGRFAMKGGVV